MSQTIIESKSISDVLSHVDQDTLVIFDIDNTLIMPTLSFGSNEWFVHSLEKLQKQGYDGTKALEKLHDVLAALVDTVPFKTVEQQTADVLQKLHDQNHCVIGLTGRSLTLKNATRQQLGSLNLSLNKNIIHDKEITVDRTTGYADGIIFVGGALGMEKGPTLFSFFKMMNYTPKRVVFVDDLHHYINSVHDSLKNQNIPGVCIRYGASDDHVAKFDPARANEELRTILGTSQYKDNFLKELL